MPIKCPVCQKVIPPHVSWWDNVEACSDCVKRAALELREKEEREVDQAIEDPLQP